MATATTPTYPLSLHDALPISRVAALLRRRLRGPDRARRPARAMSASPPPLKIPMPLRVPELAPSLGRLLVPRRLEPPWVPLDDVREELATGVLEFGGEARAAAVREERERVLDAVSRRAWLGAWERAVRRAGERVSAAVDAELEHAARRVRMPRLLRRRRLLSPSEQRAIAARLASGGRSEEHTSELQSLTNLVCRLLLEKKKN